MLNATPRAQVPSCAPEAGNFKRNGDLCPLVNERGRCCVVGTGQQSRDLARLNIQGTCPHSVFMDFDSYSSSAKRVVSLVPAVCAPTPVKPAKTTKSEATNAMVGVKTARMAPVAPPKSRTVARPPRKRNSVSASAAASTSKAGVGVGGGNIRRHRTCCGKRARRQRKRVQYARFLLWEHANAARFILAVSAVQLAVFGYEVAISGGVAPLSSNPTLGPAGRPFLSSIGGSGSGSGSGGDGDGDGDGGNGRADPSLSDSGAAWRLFPSLLAHSGLLLLAALLLPQLYFGSAFESAWGTRRAALVYTGAGAGGSAVAMVLGSTGATAALTSAAAVQAAVVAVGNATAAGAADAAVLAQGTAAPLFVTLYGAVQGGGQAAA